MERQGTADRLMLTALLRTMDLGVDARQALTDEQVRQISRWRVHGTDDLQTRIARTEATRLATASMNSGPYWCGTRSSSMKSLTCWLQVSWICPGSAPYAPRRCSCPTRTMAGSARKRPSPRWPG